MRPRRPEPQAGRAGADRRGGGRQGHEGRGGRRRRARRDGDDGAAATTRCRCTRTRALQIRPRILLEGNFFVDLEPGLAVGARSSRTAPPSRSPRPRTRCRCRRSCRCSTSDTRTDLQTLLREYGTEALGERRRARRSTARSRRSRPPTASARSPTTRCSASSPTEDLQRAAARPGARVRRRWPSNPQALQELVTDLNTTAGAIASQDAALAAAVPALRDTLRAGYPALGELNAALPTLRAFSREALPGVRSSVPTLDAAIPWIVQARGLVRRGRAEGPRRRPAPGGAEPREAQPPADPGAAPAARAVLVHEPGAGAVRRVADPEHRGRQLRPGGARADHAQLRRPGRREPRDTTRTRRSSTSRA